MHIADGVIPPSIVAASYTLSGVIVALSLRKLRHEDYPKIAIMGSAFFVASLIHIPIGPTSVHLLLPGVVGIVLRGRSYLAITLGLILQCFLFQFGGVTALGANALMMGLPALLSGWLFSLIVQRAPSSRGKTIAAIVGGSVGVILAGLILSTILFLSGEQFFAIAKLVLLAHIPVAIIEGAIAASMVSFISRVKPGILSPPCIPREGRA